jgi:hypothetical protein
MGLIFVKQIRTQLGHAWAPLSNITRPVTFTLCAATLCSNIQYMVSEPCSVQKRVKL